MKNSQMDDRGDLGNELRLILAEQVPEFLAKTPAQQQAVAAAVQQLVAFERRYGLMAVRLAAHAAFPLALTADLVYCLREGFGELYEVPWYRAADLLLSGIGEPIGRDLYEMSGAVRLLLLRWLKQHYGEGRIRELEDWMADYIVVQLRLEEQLAQEQGRKSIERSRVLGDRPGWTALCCLSPGLARQQIEGELHRIALDQPERLHLAAMLESYGALVPGLPIFLDLAQQMAAGQYQPGAIVTAPQSWDGRDWAVARGIELRSQAVEVAQVRFGAGLPSVDLDPNLLRPFEFRVVTVNKRGEVAKEEQRTSRYFVEPLGAGVPPLELVQIPGGEFRMGAVAKEPESYSDERPRHLVRVPPFFMGKYPVTQAQWRAVAGLPPVDLELALDPAHFKGEQRPVESVSWPEAQEFCRRVSVLADRPCRLPSEAEWEYACRAGTTTPFHFGPTISAELANHNGNYTYDQGNPGVYRQATTDVGSFGVANAFGLYDMHGNVWEWCEDSWHNNYQGAPKDGSAWIDDDSSSKVLRGGSWISYPRHCRSAFRLHLLIGVHLNLWGFRVVYGSARILL